MLLIIAVFEAAILVGLVVLLLRKNPLEAATATLQGLSDGLVRLENTSDHLETAIRSGIQDIRNDLAIGMGQARDDASRFFEQVRNESTGLRELVGQKLQNLTEDSVGRHMVLVESVNANLTRVGSGIQESTRLLTEEVRARLQEIAQQMTSLSEANERRLEKIQENNTAKLEEMRVTVDEKLHATLEERLKNSFGQVEGQLKSVYEGLGEMKALAVGVGDLKKVLTNVRARGGLGENQCQMQLDQVLSPDQYLKNAVIREGSRESVEFAIRIPNGEQQELLLPIDVKFPKEDWERLEDATDRGTPQDIADAREKLAGTIRTEAKKICEKYINPPRTTPYALMYLPTEGLFAEVIRIPGLADDLQSRLHVCPAGPTNFVAILNSLQMGFRAVAIQRKGTEVWRVLGAAKLEFEKFGGLMSKVERNVGTVQNTLKEIRGKTTTINRTLKDVGTLEMQPVEASALLGIGAEQDSEAPGEESSEILEMAAGEGDESAPLSAER